MADVLDLLAEVEGAINEPSAGRKPPIALMASKQPDRGYSSYSGSSGGSTPSVSTPLHGQPPLSLGHARRVSGRSEVDDLLSLLDVSDAPIQRKASSEMLSGKAGSHVRGCSTSSVDLRNSTSISGSGSSKCATVHLGGAAAELGLSRATNRRPVLLLFYRTPPFLSVSTCTNSAERAQTCGAFTVTSPS